MKPLQVLTALLFLILSLGLSGQHVIVKQSNGVSNFYYPSVLTWPEIMSVVSTAQSGDTIILPGGTFTGSSSIGLTGWANGLVIVGAGHSAVPSVAHQPTILEGINPPLGGLTLIQPPSNTVFHGISFKSSVQVASGISGVRFERCSIDQLTLGPIAILNQYGPGAVGTQLNQCIVRAQTRGNGRALIGAAVAAQNTVFNNCVLVNGIVGFASGNTTVSNCHLIDIVPKTSLGNQQTTYTNCLINDDSSLGTIVTVDEQSTFNSCAFVGRFPGVSFSFAPGVNVNNPQQSSTFASVVVSGQADTYLDTDDISPVSGGILDSNGTGSTNIGVYGGAYDWSTMTEEHVPFNPHWTNFPIALPPTNGGLLGPIVIGGQAQQN